MGLLECASRMSTVRGYDYFKKGRVRELTQTAQYQYYAEVMGSASQPYQVLIDIAHPRSSTCSCPHAAGRRIVCKHMVAVYLTCFPDEAQHISPALIANEAEAGADGWDEDGWDEDEWDEDEWDGYGDDDEWDEYDDDEDEEDNESSRVIEYVWQMKRSELRRALLRLLFDGPARQYDRFVEEHGIRDARPQDE